MSRRQKKRFAVRGIAAGLLGDQELAFEAPEVLFARQVAPLGPEEQLRAQALGEDCGQGLGEGRTARGEARHVSAADGDVGRFREHVEQVPARLLVLGVGRVHLGEDFDLEPRHLDDADPLRGPGMAVAPVEHAVALGAPLAVITSQALIEHFFDGGMVLMARGRQAARDALVLADHHPLHVLVAASFMSSSSRRWVSSFPSTRTPKKVR